jgi:hypothetical protein
LADPGVGVGVGEGKGVGVGVGLEELAAFPPQPIAMAPKRISAGAKAGLQASRRPRGDSNLFWARSPTGTTSKRSQNAAGGLFSRSQGIIAALAVVATLMATLAGVPGVTVIAAAGPVQADLAAGSEQVTVTVEGAPVAVSCNE